MCRHFVAGDAVAALSPVPGDIINNSRPGGGMLSPPSGNFVLGVPRVRGYIESQYVMGQDVTPQPCFKCKAGNACYVP